MGTTTDLIGHIDVYPPLNQAEQTYLTAFAASRRYDRPEGPYWVPRNPAAAENDPIVATEAYNSIATGQPSLWCGWVPCWEGCCIAHDGHEKFYGATPWITYLIDHFLAPGGHAQNSSLDDFSDFTFDHFLDGVVAANQRDTGELYLIRVDRNVVRRESLVATRRGLGQRELLPYEMLRDSLTEARYST
jgi:hypothetical protein